MLDNAAAAIEYAERGFHVFPCYAYRQHAKAPIGRLAPHGWQSASDNPDLVWRWWQEVPHAAIGVTGPFILDADPRHGGDDTLHDLEREHGCLPDGPIALTPRGGTHRWFKRPALAAGVELNPKPWPGIDLPRYAIAPPSHVRKTDRDGTIEYEGAYRWETSPDELPLPNVPIWMLKRAVKLPPEPRGKRKAGDDDWLQSLPPERYARDIAGLEPDRRGFVRCPSPYHRDSDPSLKLYDDHFHCFGCGAHGGVYNFWALCIGYTGELRGVAFLKIGEQILDHYTDLLGGEDQWAT